MTTANIAIVLIIILFIVIIVLNKKSIDRHNENADAIVKHSNVLNTKCDTISADNKAVEEKLTASISTLKDNTIININKAKQQAAEDAYLKAGKYTEQKANDTKKYAEELRDELITQLDKRIGVLTDIIDFLNKDNIKLREELTEQKKKLNFYANIEEDAGKLIVNEDVEERARLLALAKQQTLANREKSFEKSDDKTKGSINISEGKSETRTANTSAEENGLPVEANKVLDEEQEQAITIMDTTMDNIFITGKAGTGKSFLLDHFTDLTNKAHIVLAPTGIAALNVKGVTLHSMFGYDNLTLLDVDNINEHTIKLNDEKRSVLKCVNTIIIDEISMVRADTFDKIDRILQVVNQSELPFGGKQMIVFGDLFQLPPIANKKAEHEYLTKKYGGIFFFNSDAYKAGNFVFLELTHNHRQKDDKGFFEILNRIREGKTTEADIQKLNTRYTTDEEVFDRYTTLFPKKEDADKVNKTHMDQIESKEYTFYATTILAETSKIDFEKNFPVKEELRLRKGANVMMVANDPEGRWVNGKLGIVSELSQDSIVVSFGKGMNYEVHPLEFDEQKAIYADGKITYEKIYSIMQYPIVPAYAITIHKSQGQTYNNVVCDLNKCFACGQAYVALSRCVNLDGLHLKSKITHASIKVDHNVLDFYEEQLNKLKNHNQTGNTSS